MRNLRLFLGFPLSYGLEKKIGNLEKNLEKKIGFSLNWIPLKNLHLTVLFLGYVSLQDYLKIEEILNFYPWEEKDLLKPFHLKIKKLDFGPPGKKRMIWLYLEKNEKVEKLKNKFEEMLNLYKINYKKENRDLLLHINLCRLKKDLNVEIKENLNWGIVLNKLVLFESFLKKEGAQYEPKKIIELCDEEK
ncbi:MAG: RNA 2',3'-cyclic phosphodiesterase [Patescibacteria group bacterium]